MNFLQSEINDKLITQFASELQISRLIAFLLGKRGIISLSEARNFLNPTLTALHNPFLLNDMEIAVKRIQSALENGEKIIVYGDEDVDGISSTVILMKTLQDLGGDIDYIIPNKNRDGIGLREKFIQRSYDEGVNLIITVDCGTTNITQTVFAKELGIDVIICDHHETLAELPPALAVINPKRHDSTYPFSKLSGAGVAYKLSQAIAMKLLNLSSEQWYGVEKDLFGLAMLGTIGDRVPLINENRIFAKYGFEYLQNSSAPWIQSILQSHPSEAKKINMSTILTHFIPLLSAGESVKGKNISCELLLNSNTDKTRQWASELYAASQDWFQRARHTYGKIRSSLTVQKNLNVLLMVEREADIDVLSYCASKLKDLVKCPVIMLGFKDDCIIGEARAPKGYDLIQHLKLCEELFIDYGGHKCAAGFSIDPHNLAATIEKLKDVAARLPQDYRNKRNTNAEVEIEFEELNPDIFYDITQLAPFGEGNPAPLFLLKDAEIKKYYDGYRISQCSKSFWATKRVRHQLNFPIGVATKGDIEFFIEDTGRGYISRFQIPNSNL